MEVCSKQYSFLLEKSPQETWEQFHLRCNCICECVDRHPELVDDLQKIVQLSHYWIAHKYMKIKYPVNIEKKMIKLFIK
jgi:hypothetical protein